MIEKSLELMASKIYCVISTVGSNNQPQSALVGFSESGDLSLMMGCAKDSRKFENIISNPLVSVVIADEVKKLEVQYQGKAKICQPEEIPDRIEIHFKKLPNTKKRLDNSSQAWVLIKPDWIRYVDYSGSEIHFEERSFS